MAPKEDKIITKFKYRFSLFFAIFVAAIFTVIIITSFQQILNVTTTLSARQGIPINEKVSALIDVDAFVNLSKTLDPNDPYYETTRQKMLAIKEDVNCLYLYTMAPVNDTIFRFIIDGSGRPGDSSFSPLGSLEDVRNYDKAFFKALKTKISQFGGTIDSQDKWGRVVSTYTPILNSAGDAVGIIGCDFEAESIYLNLRFQILGQIALSLVFIIIAIVVYISLLNQVNRQNSRLIELKREAESASDAKSNFLANTSHELRTPMNAIMGTTEMILRKDISPDVYQDAQRIKQAGSSLLSIINDILDFSNIDSGKAEIHPAEYLFESLISDVINIIGVRIEDKQIDFITNIDCSTNVKLYGDIVRIRQVLLNILGNAVKYTEKGYIKLTVFSKTEGDDILLTFEITDTGLGIKDADMDKLFGNFTHLDNKKYQGTEGTGLGLAISRNLCRLMGGDLTVQSKYGEGSIFTIVIPQKVHGETLPAGTEHTPQEQAEIRFIAPEAKILIVDDIITNINVAKGLLLPYQMDIHTCTTGKEAVELVKSNRYDIVFMDHMMPGMDGIETTAAIRSLGGAYFQNLPIVALTANVVVGMKEMFLEKGFSDYLPKPIEIAALDRIIARLIPAEKRRDAGPEAVRTRTAKTTDLKISGVDTAKGIAMTGGTETGYRKVLASFRKDCEDRLPLLTQVPGERELPLFTATVHALKSAAATIGAEAVSKEAAILEAAGKNGDLQTIEGALASFYYDLKSLVEQIEIESPAETGQTEEDLSPYLPLFTEMKAALEQENIDTIDRILEELESKSFDAKIAGIINTISDQVLMTEYQAAIKTIDTLIKTAGK
ncbi:ATP-binding protein [Treponema primitia]|uniref:ATP-binding protein n=1 Tax=Treponema primitia TaxID=88058 RepID=UPI0002554D4D|nr:ATP-binding protein [Treponema primitia]